MVRDDVVRELHDCERVHSPKTWLECQLPEQALKIFDLINLRVIIFEDFLEGFIN